MKNVDVGFLPFRNNENKFGEKPFKLILYFFRLNYRIDNMFHLLSF